MGPSVLPRARAFARRHPGPVSAAAVLAISVVLLALDVTGLYGAAWRPLGDNPWWGLLTVVPGCALLAAKNRIPLLALTLGGAVFVVDFIAFGTVGMLLVLNDLIYAATASLDRAGRMRLLLALVLLGLTVLAVVGATTHDARTTLFAALLVFALLGTPFWWATAVRQAHELAELHAARADDAARMAELREQDAVRAERERMARDLHDVIAGHLSAAALRSEAALAREPDEARDRDALAAVRESSVSSLEEMRSMILLLRAGAEPAVAPSRLDRLHEIVGEASTSGLRVEVEATELPELPAAVDQAATRILREALVNVAKHAAGARVRLIVAHRDGHLELAIESGPGRATDAGGAGLGLVTMRERAEALGGRFTAGPEGSGWAVRAELPVAVRA
ncbi:signal transduction histidine kinase [Diaminobutyricimonas aerilata]|uniref:histidine kinase n=1 Tax=Diaminobutyricimonas aerilata TaxID=1162967 RepID=A0A2M9CK70_9MICO|nr:histidine kinase [Diaminobutyricimonas aerilata]PJJ72291.1 signal transduction histidine kinase [Diaminobutyricimonas aerilata]